MNKILLIAACFALCSCSDQESISRITALEKANADLVNRCTADEVAIKALTDMSKETQLGVANASREIDSLTGGVGRFQMFNGPIGEGGLPLTYLYDSKTGRVWRYFRTWSDDHKAIAAEGFDLMVAPSLEGQTAAKPAAFDPTSAVPVPAMPWQK